jgi:hypothetical protein
MARIREELCKRAKLAKQKNWSPERQRARATETPLNVAVSKLRKLASLLSATLAIVFKFKAHSIALIQHTNAGGLKRGCMDEDIFAATLIRLDKAESLSSVEELDGTTWHDVSTFLNNDAAPATRGDGTLMQPDLPHRQLTMSITTA